MAALTPATLTAMTANSGSSARIPRSISVNMRRSAPLSIACPALSVRGSGGVAWPAPYGAVCRPSATKQVRIGASRTCLVAGSATNMMTGPYRPGIDCGAWAVRPWRSSDVGRRPSGINLSANRDGGQMVTRYELPALALAVGLVTVALALVNADKIGEGLTLGVVALMSVRYWARRRADAYLADLYQEVRGCQPMASTAVPRARPADHR
jgi:hypothetical protein